MPQGSPELKLVKRQEVSRSSGTNQGDNDNLFTQQYPPKQGESSGNRDTGGTGVGLGETQPGRNLFAGLDKGKEGFPGDKLHSYPALVSSSSDQSGSGFFGLPEIPLWRYVQNVWSTLPDVNTIFWGKPDSPDDAVNSLDNHPIKQQIDEGRRKVKENRAILDSAQETIERGEKLVSQSKAPTRKGETTFDQITLDKEHIIELGDHQAKLRDMKKEAQDKLDQLSTISHPIGISHDIPELEFKISHIADPAANKALHQYFDKYFSEWKEYDSEYDSSRKELTGKLKKWVRKIDLSIESTDYRLRNAMQQYLALEKRLEPYAKLLEQLGDVQKRQEANKKILDDTEQTFKRVVKRLDKLVSWNSEDHMPGKLASWTEAHPEAPTSNGETFYDRINTYKKQMNQLTEPRLMQKYLMSELEKLSQISSPKEDLKRLRTEIVSLESRTVMDNFLQDLQTLDLFWHYDIFPHKIDLVEYAELQLKRVDALRDATEKTLEFTRTEYKQLIHIPDHPIKQHIDEGNNKLKKNRDFFRSANDILKRGEKLVSQSREAPTRKGKTTFDRIRLEDRLAELLQLKDETIDTLEALSSIIHPIDTIDNFQSEINSITDLTTREKFQYSFNKHSGTWKQDKSDHDHLITQVKQLLEKIDASLQEQGNRI